MCGWPFMEMEKDVKLMLSVYRSRWWVQLCCHPYALSWCVKFELQLGNEACSPQICCLLKNQPCHIVHNLHVPSGWVVTRRTRNNNNLQWLAKETKEEMTRSKHKTRHYNLNRFTFEKGYSSKIGWSTSRMDQSLDISSNLCDNAMVGT